MSLQPSRRQPADASFGMAPNNPRLPPLRNGRRGPRANPFTFFSASGPNDAKRGEMLRAHGPLIPDIHKEVPRGFVGSIGDRRSPAWHRNARRGIARCSGFVFAFFSVQKESSHVDQVDGGRRNAGRFVWRLVAARASLPVLGRQSMRQRLVRSKRQRWRCLRDGGQELLHASDQRLLLRMRRLRLFGLRQFEWRLPRLRRVRLLGIRLRGLRLPLLSDGLLRRPRQ